jgi:hypothetical protein
MQALLLIETPLIRDFFQVVAEKTKSSAWAATNPLEDEELFFKELKEFDPAQLVMEEMIWDKLTAECQAKLADLVPIVLLGPSGVQPPWTVEVIKSLIT